MKKKIEKQLYATCTLVIKWILTRHCPKFSPSIKPTPTPFLTSPSNPPPLLSTASTCKKKSGSTATYYVKFIIIGFGFKNISDKLFFGKVIFISNLRMHNILLPITTS